MNGPRKFSKMFSSIGKRSARRAVHRRNRRLAANRLAAIIDNAADAIITVDADHRLTTFNLAAEKMFGLNAQTVLNQRLDRFIPNCFRDLLQTGGATSNFTKHALLEVSGVRSEGSEFPLEASVSQTTGPEGNFLTLVLRDITERKQRERELENLRHFAVHNPVAILQLSGTGDALYANPTGETFLKEWRSTVGGDGLVSWHSAIKEALTSDVEPGVEIDIENRSYSVKVEPFRHLGYVNVYATDVTERKQAQLVETLSFGIDVTEQRLAEQELRNSEERYRDLVENAQEIIYTHDLKGNYLSCNRAGFLITGYDYEESKHLNFSEVVAPEYLEESRRMLQRKLNGEGVTSYEVEMIAKDGHRIPLEISSRLILQDGVPIAVTGIARDITERKVAEETLRESEERYRLLFEHNPMPLFVFEVNTLQFLAVNEACVRNYGYSREEFLAMTILDIRPAEEVPALLKNLAQADGINNAGVWTHRRKDGTLIKVEVTTHELQFKGRAARLTSASDVTERRRAEDDLLLKTSVLESQSEAGVDGILVVSPERKAISFNRRFVELWNLSSEVTQSNSGDEILKSVTDQLTYPEEFVARVNYLYEHPEERSEEELDLKDGRTFERHSAPVLGPHGENYGRIWFFRDITERKQTQKELFATQRRLQGVLSSSPAIIYSLQFESEWPVPVWITENVKSILGYETAEALEPDWFLKQLHPETVAAARRNLKQLLNDDRTLCEYRIRHKNGQYRWIRDEQRLIRNMDGKQSEIVGAMVDITEQKAAESELTRLAAAVEQTADSIVITDPAGSIQYVNPAFERITGYSKEEVYGQNPRILKSSKTDELVHRQLWATITSGKVWSGQLTNRKKDGTLFEERVTVSPVLDNSKQIVSYVAVKQDITKQVELEEQLRQSQKLEAVGQLAGGVAHDFNNLLTVIQGYSDLMLQRLPAGSEFRGNVGEIKKAGERASALTRQLLAFSRKQILQPKILNLNAIITDLEKMLRRLIGEDINLLTILGTDLDDVRADPGQIEQVIMNLLVNARDAMPRGGRLTIETQNVLHDQRYVQAHGTIEAGKYVMLAVTDTGEGMSQETRKRIFEPFFTTKLAGKGTGLGLSTVYGIVKQSGGHIYVYSEVEVGTTFKIYLPRINQQTSASQPEVAETEAPSGNETVLLVEDEDQVREIARVILESAGYRVLEAPNGLEALSLVERTKERIHCVITDLVMPKMSGRQLIEKLIPLLPEARMIYMSGYTDDAVVRHGLLVEGLEFIQKPFTPYGLTRKLRQVLDK